MALLDTSGFLDQKTQILRGNVKYLSAMEYCYYRLENETVPDGSKLPEYELKLHILPNTAV